MSEAQCLSSDIITTLPETIMKTILSLLPIEDAARTSILSRDWRYKWTKISKLEFFESPQRIIGEKQTCDLEDAWKYMDMRCKLFYAIHQVLLLHQAPIDEFALAVNAGRGCFEADQILLHLSRNHTIKNLTLEFFSGGYKLPLCFFSLHHLTELYLLGCDLNLQSILTGFGNLRCLTLINVAFSTKALLQLLTNCPSLKSLTLLLAEDHLDDECCTIMELFNCLPIIEHFNIWAGTLSIDEDECDDSPSTILEAYSDVWLDHLNELEIEYFNNVKSEMEFVKFILARSPKLKKVSISSAVETDQERLEMLKVLLRAPRASPVEIIVV